MLRNIYGVRFSMCEICMYCCLHNKDTKVYWVFMKMRYSFTNFKEIFCFVLHLVFKVQRALQKFVRFSTYDLAIISNIKQKVEYGTNICGIFIIF